MWYQVGANKHNVGCLGRNQTYCYPSNDLNNSKEQPREVIEGKNKITIINRNKGFYVLQFIQPIRSEENSRRG